MSEFTITTDLNVHITPKGIYKDDYKLFDPDLITGIDPDTLKEDQNRHAELTAELNPLNLTEAKLITHIGNSMFSADITATTTNLRPHQALGRFLAAEKQHSGTIRWTCKLHTVSDGGNNKVNLLYPQGWLTASMNQNGQTINHQGLYSALRDLTKANTDWELKDIILGCIPTISGDKNNPLLTELDIRLHRDNANWQKLTTIQNDDARALAKAAVLTLKNSPYKT